jgi:hypothetical protein
MVNEKDMKAALQEVIDAKKPNLTDIVERNNVNRTTLSKRFLEQKMSPTTKSCSPTLKKRFYSIQLII